MLVINKKLHFQNKPFIAKKDIYVIKCFSNEYDIFNNKLFLFSNHFYHKYEYNRIERSHFLVEHHFISNCTLVQNGLHSYFSYNIFENNKSIITICKIPKKSEFFVSYYIDKEIVSNNLQIIDVLFIPNINKKNQLTKFLKDDWNFTNGKNSESVLKDLSNYINKNYKNKLNASLNFNSSLNIETIF